MSAGEAPPATVRVRLPAQLQQLARCPAEVAVQVLAPVTQASVLDALESTYPQLRNTLRGSPMGRRRPFVRFYVGEEDLSNAPPGALLPGAVACGREPFVVVGAMAGG